MRGEFNKYACLPTIFAFAAFGLTLAATAWCSFVERDVEITGDDPFTNLREELRDLLLEDHGVGFWGWELGGECFDYTIGGEDPDFDTKYNSARAFTIVAAILGGFVFFSLLFSSCRNTGARSFLCYAFFSKLTCLFQGLTLLIFRSDICDAGFFGYSTGVDEPDQDPDLQGIDVDCSLSSGSRCAIGATACWFMVAVLCTGIAKKQMKANEDEGEAPPAEADKEVEDAPEEAAVEEQAET